jgi:DNA-binding IclR family transcriptional regulator
MPSAGNRRTVKSAERVLDLLEVLGRRGGGMTFGMLQSAMQIPKSSLHALLEVATARGYVDFADGTRLYTLGIKAWESSQAYLQQHDLLREARTVMERIAAETRETVQIAKLDGIENIYLAKADSTYPLRLQSEIGTRLLAHATGLGKALLACLPMDEVQSRFAGIRLPRMTANTITDMDKLVEELTATRVRGFGIDNEEYTPGVFCVAVPVRDNNDDAAIAMSISVPVLRTTLGKLAQGLSLLATGSLEISRRAGSTRSDPLLAKLSSPKNAERALLELAASKRYPLSFTPARDEARSDRRATHPT